jgi:hypothetical protein
MPTGFLQEDSRRDLHTDRTSVRRVLRRSGLGSKGAVKLVWIISQPSSKGCQYHFDIPEVETADLMEFGIGNLVIEMNHAISVTCELPHFGSLPLGKHPFAVKLAGKFLCIH